MALKKVTLPKELLKDLEKGDRTEEHWNWDNRQDNEDIERMARNPVMFASACPMQFMMNWKKSRRNHGKNHKRRNRKSHRR